MPDVEQETTFTKLTFIAERARKVPGYQFTCLAHLLNEGYLAACYRKLGRNRACGVDGVTWEEYGRNLEENLGDLVGRLKSRKYRPLPVRRVYIPKGEHDRRPLGIPSLEDKIVQKGIAGILEAIYEADFRECSYGFRPGRGCHQAVNAIDKAVMTRPVNHVVEADIKGCFDNISHDRLMSLLGERIKDPSLLIIIRRFLKAGYLEADMKVATERGTPQGGNLSPVLCNVFLHYVLDRWFMEEVRPKVGGNAWLVRYADDFVCLVRYAADAGKIEALLKARFAAFELELNPAKTRVLSFGRYERENAERQNRRPNTFEFLGFTHYCGKSRRGKFMINRKTSGKRYREKCRELNAWLKAVRNTAPAEEWWPELVAKLRGHYQYYGVSGNMRAVSGYYHESRKLARKWLNRRSQRGKYSWQEFEVYLKRHPLPGPRIAHNLFTLSLVA